MSLRYAHMCKMDHHEVGYSNWDDENCPVCRERAAREKAEATIGEIRGVVGFPGMIALEAHGLSDSLPDVVRYCHREWLQQTHAAQQHVIVAEIRAEKAEAEVARLKVVEKWARMIANAGELGADGYWHADITTPDSPPSCLTESEGER